jgi:hypothetical protein
MSRVKAHAGFFQFSPAIIPELSQDQIGFGTPGAPSRALVAKLPVADSCDVHSLASAIRAPPNAHVSDDHISLLCPYTYYNLRTTVESLEENCFASATRKAPYFLFEERECD